MSSTRDLADRHHDLAALAILVVASVFALATWTDYGITWDEAVHLEYGRHIYNYFWTGFADRTALHFKLDYLYGGSFDLAGAVFCDLVSPALDRYDAIHLFGTLVGVAGLWGTWRLGRVLAGPRAGLLAAAFIVATAVYWGHMANNPKDLPFAAAYVWAMGFLVEAIRSFPRVSWRVASLLALSCGLAMGVRIAGLLLLCYLAGAMLVWIVAQLITRAKTWESLEALHGETRRLLGTGLGVALGAWLVMVAAWPWALEAPLTRPFAALRRMSQFMGHRRTMRFAGQDLLTYDVDWRYMPHYFGLKLPEFVVVLGLLAGLVGLARVIARARAPEHLRDNLVLGTMLMALVFPWIYAVARGSILYDGLRHFLFVVPVLVAALAWSCDLALDRVRDRVGAWPARVGLALLALACVDQYATMARLHPYQYVYFNRFVGGLGGAAQRYDTDYYGASHSGAGATLADYLWVHEGDDFLDTNYRVASCSGELMTLREMPPNFSYQRRRPDLWLGYARDACAERHPEYPVILELGREGATLMTIRDRGTRRTTR